MKVQMTFDIPEKCNQWLNNFDNSAGTREDWQAVINNLFTAFMQDLQHDYDLGEEGREQVRKALRGPDLTNPSSNL